VATLTYTPLKKGDFIVNINRENEKEQLMQNLEHELNRLLHHLHDMENAGSPVCRLTVRQSARMAKHYFDKLDNE
jgi:hypothetical protein